MQQFAIVRNVRICISIRFYKYILMEVEAEASAEAKAKKKAAKKAEEEAAVLAAALGEQGGEAADDDPEGLRETSLPGAIQVPSAIH